MSFIDDVSRREVGNLPLSIGTSFAVESLTLKDQEGNPIKEKLPPCIWINIKTLFRNLHNALDTDLKKRVSPEDLTAVLVTELEFIKQYVPEVTRGVTSVVYYDCTYDDLLQKYPHANHRKVVTDLQKHYVVLEHKTTQLMLSGYTDTFQIQCYRSDIDGKYASAWMLTHAPIDLLSYKRFGKLALLESHTGRIKHPSSWNTKLTNGKEMPNIPFNAFTLQVFGDNVYFSMMPRAIKESVLEMARDYQWTSVTTMEKIRHSIAGMRDHFGREILRKIAR